MLPIHLSVERCSKMWLRGCACLLRLLEESTKKPVKSCLARICVINQQGYVMTYIIWYRPQKIAFTMLLLWPDSLSSCFDQSDSMKVGITGTKA